MQRPYDLDDNGTIHGPDNNCEYVTAGDASRDGIIQGLTEHGEGLCPDCLPDSERVELWREAAEKVELLH